MKNSSLNATCGPESITRIVNTTAATKVQKLISEFSSAAQLREPNTASNRPPVSGVSSSAMSCKSIINEYFPCGVGRASARHVGLKPDLQSCSQSGACNTLLPARGRPVGSPLLCSDPSALAKPANCGSSCQLPLPH